jgi:hypothetical protein
MPRTQARAQVKSQVKSRAGTEPQIKRARAAIKNLRLPQIMRRRQRVTLQSLINLESELGRAVFGRTPFGVRREFFYHGNQLWVYHEEFPGYEPRTISYEVRADQVLKILPDRTAVAITGGELDNFLAAARTYLVLAQDYIYGEAD